ncbi:MAG: membrane protein insertase YidC [Planctomycetota bacterium]|nr:membrane protein insertase YidC [Planctomycetota bacterium]
MPQQPSRFDPVQIFGLIVAVGLLIGGQMYLQKKHEAERQAWLKTQEEQRQQQPVPPANVTNASPQATPNGQPAPGPAPGPAPVGPADVEPADAGDIAVESEYLRLVFTARGAALRQAVLPDQFIRPAKKEEKGLELLAEIEPGKLTYALPRFEAGPPEPGRNQERLVFDAVDGPLKALSRRVWALDSNSKGFDADGRWTIRYSATVAQKYAITKTFTVYKDRRYVELEIGVDNKSAAPVTFSYSLNGPAGILLDGPPEDPKGNPYVYIVAELAGRDAPAPNQQDLTPDVLQVSPQTAATGGVEKANISRAENLWGAVKNHFYMADLISLDPTQLIRITAVPIASKPQDIDKRLAEPNTGVMGTRRDSSALEPGGVSRGDRYALYLGSSDEDCLAQAEAQLKPPQPLYLSLAMKYYDMGGYRWPRVDWLARQMLAVFRGLHWAFGNYGVAVILLTLIIKLCLHPLQRKQMVSMTKLQKLQPELKKLQEKYKNQTTPQARQKMWQEQQDIMRKGGASYGAGCLPVFVQMPIWCALYGIFGRAFDMRGAEFLWIKDLSQTDRLMPLPFWPQELNLLPVIYAGLNILQMRLTPQPKATDPQQEMQQKMMQFMPLIFTLMFYRMPAGLMLYFAVSAIYGICETWYIRKFLLKDQPAATPPAGKGVVAAKAG